MSPNKNFGLYYVENIERRESRQRNRKKNKRRKSELSTLEKGPLKRLVTIKKLIIFLITFRLSRFLRG